MPGSRTPAQALERRAGLLADKIRGRVAVLAAGLSPRPFAEHRNERRALEFWAAGRYDPAYTDYLAAMDMAKPGSLAGLDAALATHAAAPRQPDEAAPPPEQPRWP